jgi:hypothetical protein
MRFRNCPETGRQLKALVSDAASQAVISPPSLDHRVGAAAGDRKAGLDGHPEKTCGEAIANRNQ